MSLFLKTCLNTAFEDKRVVTVVMFVIIVATIIAFLATDQSTNDFLRIGPSPQTKILGIKIDSWEKWQLAIVFGTLITFINDFISVALGPFFINTILDPKETRLPYSKFTCLVIHVVSKPLPSLPHLPKNTTHIDSVSCGRSGAFIRTALVY
jgi:hypothetical protein